MGIGDGLGMRIRRCAVVLFEPREEVGFDLGHLVSGGVLRRRRYWVALAPHLTAEVEIDTVELELLGSLSPTEWVDLRVIASGAAEASTRLLQEGLLIGSEKLNAVHRGRDECMRASFWHPLGGVLHAFTRWRGVDAAANLRGSGIDTALGMRRVLGAPPPEVIERGESSQRMLLPRAAPAAFDELLARRTTCRNFDDQRPLSHALLAQMLQRVFAAQAQVQVQDDTVFLKKTSPSGGGLHATEAYLIVQNVEGVAPGLYHYHPVDHALEPLPPPSLPLFEFTKLALAGQHWFANAPALAVLTPRYARSFWKYRHHAKAYRALVLDSGHLSQTLYLSATELGLGAFVTSAINEVDIEQGFGLDPLVEGPLAICGFGWRSERMDTTEFDPAAEVWQSDEDAASRVLVGAT